MERRAASHTEEEEMNQRRKLLNAARRGDTKAISKLFELYQVRVLSGDQLAKVNRTSTYMVPVKASHNSKGKSKTKGAKPTSEKSNAKTPTTDKRKPAKKEKMPPTTQVRPKKHK